MTGLEIGLSVALGLVLIALFVVVVTLPRRVAHIMTAQHERGDARALAAKAALHAASAAEVAVIVAPLRTLREEQEKQLLTLVETVAWVRALCEWLFAFASAQHAEATAQHAPPAQTSDPQPSLGQDPHAEAQQDGPAMRAAGLGSRQNAPPLPRSETPRRAGFCRDAAVHAGNRAAERAPVPAGRSEDRRRWLRSGRCSVKTLHEILSTQLEDHEIARVDALARERGIPRRKLLAAVVHSGIEADELRLAPPASGRRVKGGRS